MRSLTCAEQYQVMAFAQLTDRECLRDIEVCLAIQAGMPFHVVLRESVRRPTLAEANESCDWRIHADGFGMSIWLPFWFLNGISHVPPLIKEALAKNRRRWILKCGPWAASPPIGQFEAVIQQAGRKPESLRLIDTAKVWLDPIEWIES